MIFDIYSKRINKKNNNDIYEYENIPEKLRMQVYYIIESATRGVKFWESVERTLLREYGREYLVEDYLGTSEENCKEFLKLVEVTNEFLDLIEVAFYKIDTQIREFYEDDGIICRNLTSEIEQSPDEAIEELNHRFKENNFGYEFIKGQIIRVDRKLIHNEIIKPALNLLFDEEFKSANDEFLTAHKYYKEGCSKENPNEDFKNAIINCNKAFESTMKIICEKNKEIVTTYNIKHTANDLINDLIEANIIPNHLSHSFHGLKNILKGLRSSLENGLPVIRNKVGHGKGTEEEWVSEEFVTYAINLAATNIVLLINIYKNL
ncbi:hypothetical protein G6Z18_03220 [Clostridium perfringens]|uniref:STM4504/CBY_0614 family protein n=1 Tax=Clostridium perfringens TaxID=1502 RepID=UPI0013E2A6B3|nr:hypothetical protein [Clostridium perfringens]MDM0462640.1 hypothetical protein [Clostridium perfringens]MDM0819808.1 hypothetical protein [Clostridium perfringens]MDO6336721.1 hypothetical protein [Clostridium perfringens]NGT62956.1 hypothetical protein [Clostridium perfringens]